MTANQRRPGFRLPWSDGSGQDADAATSSSPTGEANAVATPLVAPTLRALAKPSIEAPVHDGVMPVNADTAPEPADDAPSSPDKGDPSDFMRELVAAMRRVADEARRSGLDGLKATADEQVKAVTRPDADVAPDHDVELRIDAGRIRWLDAETGRAIGSDSDGP
jgi:hypothetical protein